MLVLSRTNCGQEINRAFLNEDPDLTFKDQKLLEVLSESLRRLREKEPEALKDSSCFGKSVLS